MVARANEDGISYQCYLKNPATSLIQSLMQPFLGKEIQLPDTRYFFKTFRWIYINVFTL